jgi:hypothetical protein
MILAVIGIIELPKQQHHSGHASSGAIVIQRTWSYPPSGVV